MKKILITLVPVGMGENDEVNWFTAHPLGRCMLVCPSLVYNTKLNRPCGKMFMLLRMHFCCCFYFFTCVKNAKCDIFI